MKTIYQSLQKGEQVILDKHYNNASQVEVVAQTPQNVFTIVTDGKTTWDVMTARLTKIENK